MSETSNPTEPATPEPTEGGKTFTQADVDRILSERLGREKEKLEKKYEGFDQIKAKASEFDKLTESTKSEIQKATEAAQVAASERDTFRSEAEKLKTTLQRQKICAAKGLDPDLWDRVIGDTEEEITADVERLVEKFAPAPRRNGALRSGASAAEGGNEKQRAALALRGVRRD